MQHLSPLPTPPGWYDIDFDDSSWTVGKDVATYGYGGAARAYRDDPTKIPGATLVGEDVASGALYEQTLVRTQFYLEEQYGLPTVAILRFDYDDILYGLYINGNYIYGPDYTAEPYPGKPAGPFEMQVAQHLIIGKNVITAHLEEGVWSIWPWNHKLECIMWRVGTNLSANVQETLQEESITTIRAHDDGAAIAPLGTGEYIPSFDSVTWGDVNYLQTNPGTIPAINLVTGDEHVFLGNRKAKYVVSVQFNIQIADAVSYPRTDIDLLVYIVWTYPGTGGYTWADWTYASRKLWLPDATTTAPVSFSAHLAVAEAGAYLFPRIVRGATPTDEPDTLTISDLKFDVMKITDISSDPRSTYGSHWDEWFEKYPP